MSEFQDSSDFPPDQPSSLSKISTKDARLRFVGYTTLKGQSICDYVEHEWIAQEKELRSVTKIMKRYVIRLTYQNKHISRFSTKAKM
ncbi:hypothetical protein MRX96_002307 [Rhipicephalus microplus]